MIYLIYLFCYLLIGIIVVVFEIIKEHLIAPIKLQDIIDAGKPMIIVLLFWPAYLGWLVWKKF